ncbi:MAG TPA: DUF4043 family protein [Roseiarcus sp.]|nr:DUF4043 family protein [Roseiarcus sp.]
MALTTVQTNNKLLVFREELMREYVRENLFSPYMGTGLTNIIRVISDLDKGGKQGGEQINIPLVVRLQATAIASGTLVGNEEAIDNYGARAWIDWARNAVKMNKRQENLSSIDLFAEAKPMLSDWGKELQRDEICQAFYALPSESAPAGLGSNNGQRVNGLLFDAATATQRNTWLTDNADRIQIGHSNTANLSAGNFATTMSNITATTDNISGALIQVMKRRAMVANPRIRPFKLKDNGTEWFVLFVGQEQFRDCQNDTDIKTANQNSRSRENAGYLKNPIFVDGDLLYDGVIIRQIPELSLLLPTFYTNAGASSIRVAPAFLCGQSAMAWCWGKMPTPTFLKEDDYQFNRGAGIEMAYGVEKIFKKTAAGNLREWGVFTGFFPAVQDS